MSESLRMALKNETMAAHKDTEGAFAMKRLMKDDVTAGDYVHVLTGFLSVYEPLEKSLALVDFRGLLPDVRNRWKTNSLRQDLIALGVVPAPSAGESSPMSLSKAMGVLYVMEGSTLGAKLIEKHLKTMPFVHAGNLNFFTHYGAESGIYWQKFTAALEKGETEGLLNKTEVLEGAHEAFALVKSAMSTPENQAPEIRTN